MTKRARASPPYQYQPLQPDQIRLLRLYAPVVQKVANGFGRVFSKRYKTNPPLHGRLITVNLNEYNGTVPGFDFEAISAPCDDDISEGRWMYGRETLRMMGNMRRKYPFYRRADPLAMPDEDTRRVLDESGQYLFNFVNMFTSFSQPEASFPRDRFFALLGFAADVEPGTIVPDYTQALIAHSIGQSLGPLLREAGLAQHAQRDIPSWCLGFNRPKGYVQWVLPTDSDAGGGTRGLKVEFVPRYKDVITVRAKRIDVIPPHETPTRTAVEVFPFRADGIIHPGDDNIYHFISHALVRFLHGAKDVIYRLRLSMAADTICPYVECDDRQLWANMWGLVVLPRGAKPGDEVWIVQGSFDPVLLRPSQEPKRLGMLQLVGSCVCLDVMAREALSWTERPFTRIFLC